MTVDLTKYEIEILIECVNEDAARSYMTPKMQAIVDKLLQAIRIEEV